MILHTLNALPESASFRDCLYTAGAEDAILLLGDGVYAGIAETAAASGLASSAARLLALAPDVAAAGIGSRLHSRVEQVDIAGFVALSEGYSRQLAWY